MLETSGREIHPAHPRRALFLLATIGVAMSLAIITEVSVDRWTSGVLEDSAEDLVAAMRTLLVALRIVALLGGLGLGASAAICWSYGARVQREGRYPTAATVALRDIPVLRGAEAGARGRLVQNLALVLAALALILPVGTYWMAARLLESVAG